MAQLSSAAERMSVTVSHDLAEARTAETITVPWSEIASRFPGVLPNRLVVKDGKEAVVPCQLINSKPNEHHDHYESLIFQHDFAAGEQKAVFTLNASDTPVPPYPTKTFGRHIPERYDDFAWENDRVAFRVYGPGLNTEAAGKERMISSGIDVWSKRVRYPILDRWYLIGHYHDDTGEGLDFYETGKTRGCGGTGVWNGKQLFTSQNWKTCRVIANGPVRTTFELTYDFWDAGDVKVAETKRLTLDAGHHFVDVESEFQTQPADVPLTIAIGLAKHTKNIVTVAANKNEKNGWFALWEKYAKDGQLGTGVILPEGAIAGFAEDELNHLVLTKMKPGRKVRYFLGAGWDRGSDFPDQAAWEAHLDAVSRRSRSPLKIAYTP